eukprot:scpid41075/ scgid16795/ 
MESSCSLFIESALSHCPRTAFSPPKLTVLCAGRTHSVCWHHVCFLNGSLPSACRVCAEWHKPITFTDTGGAAIQSASGVLWDMRLPAVLPTHFLGQYMLHSSRKT